MRTMIGNRWLVLCVLCTLAMPAASQGAGLLRAWWERIIPLPFNDMVFDNSTTGGRLTEITVGQRRTPLVQTTVFNGATLRAAIEDETLKLFILGLNLENGDTTVEFDRVDVELVPDAFGSSFRTVVTAEVDVDGEEIEIECQVRGRVTIRNGIIYLTGIIVGSETTRLNPGVKLQLVSVPFSTSADATDEG